MSRERAAELAERASSHMHEHDRFAALLGFERCSIEPGRAVLSVVVREDMLNGHAICHGGLVFTLADTAFAHACNSHNRVSVAAACSVEFMQPVRAGDTLTATGEERLLRGRSGIYDVTVVNQHDQIVALFRGRSRSLDDHLVATDPPAGAISK